MHRGLIVPLCLLVAAALLAGCGGSDSGPAAVTRDVDGSVSWPSGVTVTDAVVTVNAINASGVAYIPSAYGTYNVAAATYTVPSVPTDTLAVVQVVGTTSTGSAVTLAAAIGSSLGRSRAGSLTVNLTVAKTVAALALAQRVKAGLGVSGVTPALLANLEAAGETIGTAASVASTEAVVAAAARLLAVTNNGATPGFGPALVGTWSGTGGSATVQADGTVNLQAAGASQSYSGVLKVTGVTTAASGVTYDVTVSVDGTPVPFSFALSDNGSTLTISSAVLQQPLVLAKAAA